MNSDFSRIKRLPPYVFNITGALKMAARRRGEDIIDFSMGNPDGPTPKHIVDKMIEVASRDNTHGYSVSKGIPRLRKAISNWYKRKFDVDIDPDEEAIVTIGSKEGIAHLMLACTDRGDTVLVPNPSYPIHIYGAIIAGADIRSVKIMRRLPVTKTPLLFALTYQPFTGSGRGASGSIRPSFLNMCLIPCSA
jgi:alanine-synthesizing transaminase